VQNVADTVISQYSASPVLRAIIDSINEWIDPGANIDDFYSLVWNLDTAVGYGLDVWGRIVGVGRVLQISQSKYWGYSEATVLSADPYGQSPFFGGQALNNNFVLSDDGFRTLILAKAAANICDGSIPAINAVLMTLFSGRGNAFVIDHGDMSMDYAFAFTPTPVEISIIQQSGVLPKPTGVSVNMVLV